MASAQHCKLFLVFWSLHCLQMDWASLKMLLPLAATALAVLIMSAFPCRSPRPRAKSAICTICSDIALPTEMRGLLSSRNSSVSSRRDMAAAWSGCGWENRWLGNYYRMLGRLEKMFWEQIMKKRTLSWHYFFGFYQTQCLKYEVPPPLFLDSCARYELYALDVTDPYRD